MSERGADFLLDWVAANIHPQVLPAEDAAVAAESKARACQSDAAEAGVSLAEMEAEVGPLTAYMRTSLTIPTEGNPTEFFDGAAALAAGAMLSLPPDPTKA